MAAKRENKINESSAVINSKIPSALYHHLPRQVFRQKGTLWHNYIFNGIVDETRSQVCDYFSWEFKERETLSHVGADVTFLVKKIYIKWHATDNTSLE